VQRIIGPRHGNRTHCSAHRDTAGGMQSHDAAPCEIALLQHGGKATIIPQGHTNPEAVRPVTATR
jgi:hypothetical protein